MDYGITMEDISSAASPCKARAIMEKVGWADILRKDLDNAASKALVANTADAVLGDHHPPISALITTKNAIAKPEFRLFAHSEHAAHTGHDSAFVDEGICRAYATFEVGFEVFYR